MNIIKYFPHILIFSYLIRLLVTGASIGDALVIFVFGALLAGQAYLEHIKEPAANQDLRDAIKRIESTQENIKSKMSSISVAQTLRK